MLIPDKSDQISRNLIEQLQSQKTNGKEGEDYITEMIMITFNNHKIMQKFTDLSRNMYTQQNEL